MAYAIPNKAPGAYAGTTSVGWTFDPNVTGMVYNTGSTPPVISEYIAYDTLTPANPFIAVTQDGKGKVYYDGGFPKLYNSRTPDDTVTTLAAADTTFRYIANVINWIANPTKVAAGNKNILILGDNYNSHGVEYSILNTTDANSFGKYLDKLASLTGFTFTKKTIQQYTGTTLDPTLAEMRNYCAVILFSSNKTITAGAFTENALQDIQTYRSEGNGIAIFTDDGPVINDFANAYPPSDVAWFMTANQLSVKFNAWFSGNYDRTPVSVGYIRENYGDHPLYNGLLDTDTIYAGGSESRVFVNSVSFGTPTGFSSSFTTGTNRINFLVKLSDGSVVTESYVYLVGSGNYVAFKDSSGTAITSLDVGYGCSVRPDITLDGSSVGTMHAYINRSMTVNSVTTKNRIGEVNYDSVNGSVTVWWGGDLPVYINNGDKITVDIDTPFAFTSELPLVRYQPAITPPVRDWSKLNNVLRPKFPGNGVYPSMTRKYIELCAAAQPEFNMGSYLSVAQHVQCAEQYINGTIQKPTVQTLAYDNDTDLQNALATLTPPTLKQIFDNWTRFSGDNYFPKGSTPTGDAASWRWDDTLQAAVQDVNTASYNGFLSDETPETYDLEVTLTSTDADDDFNSVVMAFYRDPDTNLNHTLDLVISGPSGGWSSRSVWPIQSIVRDFNQQATWAQTPPPRYKEYSVRNVTPAAGWSNRYIRVKVSRRGDVFNVRCSDWNTTVYNAAYDMTININDYAELAIFKGGKSYGFGSLSQAKSSFKDIVYTGGLQRNLIVDVLNNNVYRYTGTGWVLLTGVQAQALYGSPRIVASFDTGKQYRLEIDGSVTTLS